MPLQLQGVLLTQYADTSELSAHDSQALPTCCVQQSAGSWLTGGVVSQAHHWQ